MIKRDTDVEVVSKATTNQRIGRTNVKNVYSITNIPFRQGVR